MTVPTPAGPAIVPEPPLVAGPVPQLPSGRLRRARRAAMASPATGWSSVLVMALMLLVGGLAMDAPRLAGATPGSNDSQTAFLPLTIMLGGLMGLILARLPLPAILAHLLGAVAGTAVLLVGWGMALSTAPTFSGRLAEVNRAAAALFQDVVVERGRTQETIGFLMVVGIIAWTTGQFAAYNLVRRGIVAPGIVAVGTVVLVMALAPTVAEGTLYLHLVAITGLALLLVLRSNLAHQQAGWRRRRIVGGRGVQQLFLRGGTLVCILALAGASLLAANVTAAPLKDALTSWDQRFGDLTSILTSLFGAVGSGTDAPTGEYGATSPLVQQWDQRNDPVFTAQVSDGRQYYWRGAAYAIFDGGAWSRDPKLEAIGGVAASTELLAGSMDAVTLDASGTVDVEVVVTNASDQARKTLLSPATPLSVDRDAIVRLDGIGGPFGEIELRDQLAPATSYVVQARVPAPGVEGLTQNQLAASGTGYDAEFERRYTSLVPGTLSQAARDQASRVAAGPVGGPQDPFHKAKRLEAWFAGEGDAYENDAWDFRYETDIRGVCSPGQGVVDCLLKTKVGFCEQYATAMTLMLRSQSIPARYVQGFLPGRLGKDGTYTIPMSAAHAWVEVYFPGHGWVRFDPTPGGNQEMGQSTTDLPLGSPEPTPTPPDQATPDPSAVPSSVPSPSPVPTASPSTSQAKPPQDPFGTDLPLPLLVLLVLLVLLAVVGLIVLLRMRRIPGRSPDLLYRALAVLAARLGHGPRPEQTAYEFTAALARSVPEAALDLHAVAQAKVESTYAQRTPGGAALDSLVDSYRRARRALWGLIVRRRGRR